MSQYILYFNRWTSLQYVVGRGRKQPAMHTVIIFTSHTIAYILRTLLYQGTSSHKDIEDNGLTSLYYIYSLAWDNKGVWPHSSNHASGLPQQGAGRRHLPYLRVSTETSFYGRKKVFECFGFHAFLRNFLSRNHKFEYFRK
jgi:hypothetical protein